MTAVHRWFPSVVATVLLAACATVLAPEVPAPEREPAPAGFQDCEPPYAFDGESTIAALGIEPEGLTHELTMRGHIRITRDAITHEEFAPPGVPVHIPEGQVLCATWQDGSGLALMLSEPWGPPGAFDLAGGEGRALLELAVLAAVIVAAALVSWLAFRREPKAP